MRNAAENLRRVGVAYFQMDFSPHLVIWRGFSDMRFQL